MKQLHKFIVSVTEKRNKTENIVENGQPVTKTREVEEPVDYTFVLKQLSRSETDSARLFNGASLKRAIDAGLITKAVLVQKHIDGNGSLISRDTAKRILDLNTTITALKDEVVALGIVKGDKVKQEKQEDLLMKFDEATRELRAIEGSNQAVFSATAENYASERSNLWIMLNQTYVDKAGKLEPFFAGPKFEDKEKSLEAMEEGNDKLYYAAAEKISLYWGYFLGGLITTPEDFVELDKRLAKQAEDEKKQAEDEKKEAAEAGITPTAVAPAPTVDEPQVV